MKLPLALLLTCFFITLQAKAQDFYLAGSANVGAVKVSSASFSPATTEFRIGYYVQPQIGIEFHAMAGINSDDDLTLETEIPQNFGVTARFETPERNRGKIMILLGYAFTEIDLSLNESDFPGSEDFDGMSFGLGTEYRIFPGQEWYLGAKAIRYLNKDDVRFDTMGIDVRYAF